MKEVKTAIYPFPWSVSNPEQRVVLNGDRRDHVFEFFGTPVILAPPGTQLFLTGKSIPLPKLGPSLINNRGQLFEVPHGFLSMTSLPLVELTLREQSHSSRLSFVLRGAIDAPEQREREKIESRQISDGVLLHRLIMSWIDIINEILGILSHAQNDGGHPSRAWTDIAALLLKEKEQSEPRMALIAWIAMRMAREVSDICMRPRRILLCTRQAQRMDRIQEVDGTCLRWLARQPGLTIPQKAGAKQELLAIVRKETHDTLENRILKDFLKRCKHVALEYLGDQKKFHQSKRYKTVQGFKTLCGRMLRNSPISDVQSINRIVKPNYVLQCGQRYRKIWDWYQRLLHQDQELDEAWTWQSRLWTDISRLLVAVALTSNSQEAELKIYPLTDSEAKFRTEQLCGTWLIPDSMAGPCFFEYDGKTFVIELIDSYNAAEHELCQHLGQLGGHLYALTTDINSRKQVLIVFWAIHGAGSNAMQDLKQIAVSASKSLFYNYESLKQLYADVPKIAGCVLVSTLSDITGPQTSTETQPAKVQVIQLPSRPEQWHDALNYIQIFLVEALDLIKGGA